jgi:Raf kinase inhibitor-like YbhB/YbcL family protein
MNLSSIAFSDGEPIPERYAALKNDGPQATKPAENVSPPFSWTDVPAETKSFVLLCRDPDVPADRTTMNRAEAFIADDAPRAEIYHWVVVDLPGDTSDVDEGAYSQEAPPAGMPSGDLAAGVSGINDIRKRAAESGAGGADARYDGPAPPWNDQRVHRYEFTLYALSVPTLGLTTPFHAADVLAAMEGKVLDSATLTGVYTLNPALAPTQVGSTTAT